MNSNNYTVALIGNPNSGKTSLFNSLTGARQRTGNMAGVTVTSRSGSRQHRGVTLNFIDLPGIYSLSNSRVEERVTRDYLQESRPDLVLNVLDASNLARNMALTTQLMEQEQPLLLALNMLDEVERNGGCLDTEKLSHSMGLPVVPSDGRKSNCVPLLLDRLVDTLNTRQHLEPLKIDYEPHVEQALQLLVEQGMPRWQAVQWLESGGNIAFALSE